jgi:hypothetical protein
MATTTRTADLAWLKKADHWGDWIRFSDIEAAEPEQVWMMRHASGRVRFYGVGVGQVGPEHAHIVAATHWAYAERWIDPELSMPFNLQCRAWVLDGGATKAVMA